MIKLQGEIDKCTIIAVDFDIFLSVPDRSIRKKIGKNLVKLKSTIN
jgi:hypothetical protein